MYQSFVAIALFPSLCKALSQQCWGQGCTVIKLLVKQRLYWGMAEIVPGQGWYCTRWGRNWSGAGQILPGQGWNCTRWCRNWSGAVQILPRQDGAEIGLGQDRACTRAGQTLYQGGAEICLGQDRDYVPGQVRDCIGARQRCCRDWFSAVQRLYQGSAGQAEIVPGWMRDCTGARQRLVWGRAEVVPGQGRGCEGARQRLV